jgi:hypothetical protein
MDKEPESNAWKKRKKMAKESLEKDKKMIDWKMKDTIFVMFPNAEICTDEDGQVIIYTGEDMGTVFLSPKDR